MDKFREMLQIKLQERVMVEPLIALARMSNVVDWQNYVIPVMPCGV
jgi:hypothetical protein